MGIMNKKFCDNQTKKLVADMICDVRLPEGVAYEPVKVIVHFREVVKDESHYPETIERVFSVREKAKPKAGTI